MAKQAGQDEETQGSGSAMSGLSSLDDSDDFGRQVLQHARDEQRIQALQARGQAFLKARPHPRVALTMDNLERNEAVNRRDSPQGETGGHRAQSSRGSSNGSEPPVNVPREWGRKARQSNGWLRRMQDVEHREAQMILVQQQRDESIVIERRTVYTGDENGHAQWDSSPSRPMQPFEDGTSPSSRRRLRHASSPASVTQHNDSIERLKEWEMDQDLTGASLLASTPAIPARNGTLDEIRRREIQGVQDRAVASSRLHQIRQRTPIEARPRTSSAKVSSTEVQSVSQDLQETRPATSPETRRFPKRASFTSDKENVPLNPQRRTFPFDARKDISTEVMTNGDHRATAPASLQRSENRRTDTLNLLKELARVSSPSPSPGTGNAVTNGDAVHVANRQNQEQSKASPPPRLDGDKPGNGNIAEGLTQSSSQISSQVIVDKQSQVQREQNPKETPALVRTILPAKTPVVTGAWVGTPGRIFNAPPSDKRPSPEGEQSTDGLLQPPQEAQTTSSDHNHDLQKPTRPSSGLADLVRDARLHPTAALGDDTIASLEDLLDPTLTGDNASQTLELGEPQGELDRLHDAGRPLTQADKDRRQELLAIEGMNQRLRKARISIKDASRGLRRVEQTVAEAADAEQTRVHQSLVHGSVFKALWHEWWSLFFTWDKGRLGGLRPTGLGTMCLVFLGWYLLERTMCSFYCHPRYARTMIGYGVDPDAPRYPFVIPTLFFRPFRWLWQPLLQLFTWSCGMFFSYMYSFITSSDSVSDGVGGGSSTSSSSAGNIQVWYPDAYSSPEYRIVPQSGGLDSSGVLEKDYWSSWLKIRKHSSGGEGESIGKTRKSWWGLLGKGASNDVNDVWTETKTRAKMYDERTSGHLEKGNSWSTDGGQWEAGPGSTREEMEWGTMGDDEVLR